MHFKEKSRRGLFCGIRGEVVIERYKTILKPAEIEIFEKKSQFIGHAFPVMSEEEAMERLGVIRKIHAKATHNCWAWHVAGDGGKNHAAMSERQSDDGEPSGTAGMPMLDYLKKAGLKNVLVVVTRYYGGILLGTGGLVRAYGKAAKEATEAACIIEKILHAKLHISVPYTLGGKLEYELHKGGQIIHDTIYADNMTFVVLTEHHQAENLTNHIINITANAAAIFAQPSVYCADVGGKMTIIT